MRIRPPLSPEPSTSRASNLDGVEGRPLPSLSQLQMIVAATVLEGGCQETSESHENSATGCIVVERPFLKLLTVWLSSPIHPLPTTAGQSQSVLRQRGSAGRQWVGWRDENSATHVIGIWCFISKFLKLVVCEPTSYSCLLCVDVGACAA